MRPSRSPWSILTATSWPLAYGLTSMPWKILSETFMSSLLLICTGGLPTKLPVLNRSMRTPWAQIRFSSCWIISVTLFLPEVRWRASEISSRLPPSRIVSWLVLMATRILTVPLWKSMKSRCSWWSVAEAWVTTSPIFVRRVRRWRIRRWLLPVWFRLWSVTAIQRVRWLRMADAAPWCFR